MLSKAITEVWVRNRNQVNFLWLIDNEMIANTRKCQLFLSSEEDHRIEINRFIIKAHSINNFLLHILMIIWLICKNTSRKVYAHSFLLCSSAFRQILPPGKSFCSQTEQLSKLPLFKHIQKSLIAYLFVDSEP